MIPDAERVVGDYLRAHAAVVALDARVAGKPPSRAGKPWVTVRQLDAANQGSSDAEHLIHYMLQLDCYAGRDAQGDERGQFEANLLARTVRAALVDAPDATHAGGVVSSVRFVGDHRIPDPDFEPALERVVITATVGIHP